jgi:dolichol-phosphate mannosyltransferase
MPTPPPRCLVVVPTYDEADTIERFLDEVLAATRPLDASVLVVDDNSPDGTGDLVRAHDAHGDRVQLLTRATKDGLGSAYRAGFAWAVEHGYDVVVQVDADGSHPVDRIPAMVAGLAQHDLVIGSRYVDGGASVHWPLSRRALSMGANLYVRLTLGLRTHDATAGFRAWRSSTLVDLSVLTTESSGYCFQIESSWRAERAGARVLEVPITFTERRAGVSKMSGDVAFEALTRVAIWRCRELAHRLATAAGVRRPANPRPEARRAV